MKNLTCEAWIFVDQDGDYGAGQTREAAVNNYEEEIGFGEHLGNTRLIKVTVTVPMPDVTCLEGTAPALEGEASLTVE